MDIYTQNLKEMKFLGHIRKKNLIENLTLTGCIAGKKDGEDSKRPNWQTYLNRWQNSVWEGY